MKRAFIFALMFQVILGLSGFAIAADLSADQILLEVDRTMSSDSKIMTQEMTLVSATGQERTREIQLQNKRTKQKESMLVRFLAPSDVRGTGMLMDGDDTWLYLPALGKSRRIAGHAKKGSFMGSDLSYDDMQQLGMTGFGTDFVSSLVGTEELNGSQTFVLELLPKDSESDYSKLVMWVDQEYFLPRQIEYIDLSGKLLKVLHNEGLQEIDGRWLASTMEMNNVQTGTKTILQVSDVEFDLEIPDSQFTIRSLERGL